MEIPRARRHSPPTLAGSRVVLTAVLFCALFAGLLAPPSTWGAAPVVSATIEPSQITMGETAELTITASGGGTENLQLPQVPGLIFGVVGRSQRLQIINGSTFASTSVLVRVTPKEPGIYTIPGLTPNSQPLVLRVNPDNGAPGTLSPNPPGMPRPNTPGIPPAVLGTPGAGGIRMSPDGSSYVRLVLPKHEIFVGEDIPVDIELGLRAGFVTSLNGLPTLTGSEFTLNNLSHQPERVERLVDGKPFVVLTWHSVLAGVKPGKYSLSVETPLTVRVRTQAPRDSLIDDMLGDPFMQNMFGATVPKDITVTSPTAELTVTALPTDGRPKEFSGAVGSFEIRSDLSSTTAAAGDPLTLRLHVTGAGSFDRVDTPMLDHVDGWKTYPPKSTFKPSDALGIKGDKTFEQPLIAAQPGQQTVPGVSFSYFDPATRRYETAHSAPLAVNITPSVADKSLGAPQTPSTGSAPVTAGQQPAPSAVPLSTPGPDGLRPDHPVTADTGAGGEAGADALVPLYLRPRFLALPSLFALACAAVWLARRRRTSVAGHADGRRRGGRAEAKAMARRLAEVEAAAQARDPVQFFGAARAALQGAYASRWHLPPDEVTTTEVQSRLGDEEAGIQELFALADEARYSGDPPSATDYARWLDLVRREVQGTRS